MKAPDRGIAASDQVRLLKVEIYLKGYVLLLALFGYVLLEFLGIHGPLSVPKGIVSGGLLGFVILNAVYLYLLRAEGNLSLLFVFVAITDILFFTLLIHFLGGAEAPVLALLYILPIPFYSIFVSPWSGYVVAIGSCLAYTILCGLEYVGVVAHYGDLPISVERLSIVLFFLFFCFISIAFYVGYFSDVLRRHQRALAEAKEEIERHNVTLEDKIATRTRELETAKGKLEEYSRRLEQAYNEKSSELEEVQRRLETSLGELKLKYNYENIVGTSRRIREVFRLMDKVTDFTVPILIQGESGTGKELVSKAIHYNGPRRSNAFVIQNCSAITDTLLESELFGHVKGAFTGAHQDRKGLFEEADGGTLFLDEIGDMSPTMQAKLLRAIQEGEIRPVGGKGVTRVDVRIISATNKDLKAAVNSGEFREDLYYRLNGLTLHLPALRERREDILLLVDHFFAAFAEETKMAPKHLSSAAKRLFLAYGWPGNVREMENTVKNACVIAPGEEVQVEDLRYKPELYSLLSHSGPPVVGAGAGNGVGGVEAAGGDALNHLMPLKELEKRAIEAALQSCNGKRKDAAQVLDIPIRTLYEKMKRYGIR